MAASRVDLTSSAERPIHLHRYSEDRPDRRSQGETPRKGRCLQGHLLAQRREGRRRWTDAAVRGIENVGCNFRSKRYGILRNRERGLTADALGEANGFPYN